MIIELETRLNNLVDSFNDFKKDYKKKEFERNNRIGKISNLVTDLSRMNPGTVEHDETLSELENEIKLL